MEVNDLLHAVAILTPGKNSTVSTGPQNRPRYSGEEINPAQLGFERRSPLY
jgi:hypothetical protein